MVAHLELRQSILSVNCDWKVKWGQADRGCAGGPSVGRQQGMDVCRAETGARNPCTTGAQPWLHFGITWEAVKTDPLVWVRLGTRY